MTTENASPFDKPVLVVVDHGFERKHYVTLATAASGVLGINPYMASTPAMPILVYRLDEEASKAMWEQVQHESATRDTTPITDRRAWHKTRIDRLKAILGRVFAPTA